MQSHTPERPLAPTGARQFHPAQLRCRNAAAFIWTFAPGLYAYAAICEPSAWGQRQFPGNKQRKTCLLRACALHALLKAGAAGWQRAPRAPEVRPAPEIPEAARHDGSPMPVRSKAGHRHRLEVSGTQHEERSVMYADSGG